MRTKRRGEFTFCNRKITQCNLRPQFILAFPSIPAIDLPSLSLLDLLPLLHISLNRDNFRHTVNLLLHNCVSLNAVVIDVSVDQLQTPPTSSFRSKSVTEKPRERSSLRAVRPAGPVCGVWC